jgi:hypothetical protein
MNKQIFTFAFALIALIFFSCNNDDDGGSTTSPDPIVGTWNITEINFNFQEDGVETFDQSFSTDVCSSTFFFSFEEDNTLTIPNIEFDLDFDLNDNASLICDDLGGTISGSWSFNSGNDYIINFDGEPSQVQVNFSNNDANVEIIIVEEDFDEFDQITYTDTITFRGTKN